MPKQFQRGDVVELKHPLSFAATLSVTHPVAHHLSKPMELSIPAGAHAVIEKTRDGEAYLFFPASDDVEVKRWVQKKYLEPVQ